MRAVIQRVTSAKCTVNGEITGQIGLGMVVLLGVAPDDTVKDLEYLAKKCTTLRIFEDEAGKMNLGPAEVKAEFLVISQFTLLADCNQGRRPYYGDAAAPDIAIPLYEQFVETVRKAGFTTATGIFGAMMDVELTNSGPVTIILDSRT